MSTAPINRVSSDEVPLERKVTVDGHMVGLSRYDGPNPFVSSTPVTCYETIKMIIMTLICIPLLRIILILLVFLFAWLFAVIGNCCGKCFFKYLVRGCLRIVLFIQGFYWITVKDLRKKGPRKANLLVANHISVNDHIKIILDTGCSTAGKSEVFSNPLLGPILKLFDCIPVNRHSSEGRKTAMKAISDRAADLSSPPLLVFPEGTTSIESVLTMFKAGSFVPGQPVQPICIRYPHCHFDQYLGGLMWTLYRTFCQIYNCAHYTYLEEYIPSEEEKKDAKLFANNVRKVMQQELNAEITEHSFVDMRFKHKAQLKGVDAENIVLADVRDMFNMKHGEVAELLKSFKEMDKDQDGHISFQEFCKIIKFNPKGDYKENAERLYNLLDTDRDGKIDFGDFIAAMSVFGSEANATTKARLLFDICDIDNDGIVSQQDFIFILNYSQESTSNDGSSSPSPKSSRKKFLDEAFVVVFQNEPQVNKNDFIQHVESHPDIASNMLKMLLAKHVN